MALLVNVVLMRHIGEWSMVASASVAAAVFIGWPLVVGATVVSGLVCLSHSVSPRVKYAHCIIVTLAAISTFSLTLHFAM
jgi:phosphatidylserine synthase